jgi:hypothetical protein
MKKVAGGLTGWTGWLGCWLCTHSLVFFIINKLKDKQNKLWWWWQRA